MKKLTITLDTIEYSTTAALEVERRRQLDLGRKQSLKLLQAVESELKARARNGGKRPTIEDFLG